MTDHVLVPLDDSPLSEHALRHALEEHPDATVTALHVLDFVEGAYDAPLEGAVPGHWENWYDNAEARADRLFEDAADIAREYGAELETETVLGRPDRTIVDYADEHDVDLVVMGSHGRTGVQRILVGSVAEKVVRRAPCPVTVVR